MEEIGKKLNIKNYILICRDNFQISLRWVNNIFELIENYILHIFKVEIDLK